MLCITESVDTTRISRDGPEAPCITKTEISQERYTFKISNFQNRIPRWFYLDLVTSIFDLIANQAKKVITYTEDTTTIFMIGGDG